MTRVPDGKQAYTDGSIESDLTDERRQPEREQEQQAVYFLLLYRTQPALRTRLRQQEAPFGSPPSGVSAFPGIASMNAFVSALSCLIPLAALATEGDAIMRSCR
jgi:hypothetical protein